MARGDNVQARILERIKNSAYRLTVHYPPGKPVVTGVTPGPAPSSPLTGPAKSVGVVVPDPTPAQDPVTVKCLWYDAFQRLQRNDTDQQIVGWVAGAEVLARVAVAEAALDLDDPSGDTIFTAAGYVEQGGHRYKVLSVKPIGSAFAAPVTYYVWLKGAAKQ